MNKNIPLVSVIIPTLNSGAYLDECLSSIAGQSYKQLEIIVVDNFSIDDTSSIARKYTENFFLQGSERSSQRNFGAKKARGTYLLFIDSDMSLSKTVVSDCVAALEKDGAVGVIIPEKSFGKGFWSSCKALERSFYVGVDWIEAARFMPKVVFSKFGGYDENLISGEDWDLSQKINKLGKLTNISSYIYHNEGNIRIISYLKKKYYYARHFAKYRSKTANLSNSSIQANPAARYKLFFSQPGKLMKNPLIGFGMLLMKALEFAVGALGLISAKDGR